MVKSSSTIIYQYQTSCVDWIEITVLNNKIEALKYIDGAELDTLKALPIWLQKVLDSYFIHHINCSESFLHFSGTDFQISVWKALLNINYGETKRYLQIAQQLKSAAIAVGQACKRNPILILVPCHRVVSKNGLGGYEGATSGYKLDRKTSLLEFEGVKL